VVPQVWSGLRGEIAPAAARPGGTWHLGAVFLRINGVLHYLWRAVDQHGVVLDILVQDRRNASAAKCFLKRLLAGLRFKPRRIVTDGLRSYSVARREFLPDVRHRTSRYSTTIPQQQSRELPSPDPAARAPDAAVQVTTAGPAVPLGPQHDLWALPSAAVTSPHPVVRAEF
jgi:transposase-like protein